MFGVNGLRFDSLLGLLHTKDENVNILDNISFGWLYTQKKNNYNLNEQKQSTVVCYCLINVIN